MSSKRVVFPGNASFCSIFVTVIPHLGDVYAVYVLRKQKYTDIAVGDFAAVGDATIILLLQQLNRIDVLRFW